MRTIILSPTTRGEAKVRHGDMGREWRWYDLKGEKSSGRGRETGVYRRVT